MMKSIKTLCFVGTTAFLTACGWHFDNGAAVPAELKTMALESSDPYSEMSMAMRNQTGTNAKRPASELEGSSSDAGRFVCISQIRLFCYLIRLFSSSRASFTLARRASLSASSST